MTKAEVRKFYKQKRTELSYQETEKFTDLVLINFQHIKLPFLSYLHTYIASEKLGEVDPSAIIRYLKFKNPGLKILVPKIDIASGDMEHFHFNDDVELIDNAFGIAEPAAGETFSAGEIDLVLAPLLAFDVRGFRIGYGKGYYDRFLSQCRPDVIKIGLSFFEPVEAVDDINQYDIPLNYCVTPHQVFEF
jgi:5-formyltetrahydrofolate cyclo-ligase